jgi:multidrug efflux pump subunit AcrA (membrane-fusion protein)
MTVLGNRDNNNNDDILSVVNTNVFSWRSLRYLLYSPHWMARSFLYLVSIILLAAFLFMVFFKVDIVIAGRGRVVPSRPAVLLQSDSVRTVRSIFVILNENVKKDDELVTFEGSKNKKDKDNILKSPINGEITDIFVSSPGEVVSVGGPIIRIVPEGSRKTARISINEADIASIKEGDSVKVKIDAFPFRKYGLLNGKIEWISQKPEVGEENVYPILATLDIPEKFKLLYGMQLTGEIIISKEKLYRKIISEIFFQGQEF